MTSDNGQGVWGFIILIACLLLFPDAFIKIGLFIVACALGLFLIVWVLDKFRFFSLGMPKDEDE